MRSIAMSAAVLALLTSAGSAASVQEGPSAGPPEGSPVETGWRVDLGAGVLAYPRFPGSRDTRVLPIPAIEVHYADRFFASVREGIGYNVIRSGGFALGPVVNFAFPREEKDDRRALTGLGNVALTVEAGGFVRYDVGPFGSAKIEARRGINGHEGVVVDGSIDLNVPPLLNNKLFLSVGAKVSFYDKAYTRAYYGVTGQQSLRAGYAVFNPGVGYQAGGGVGATYLLSPKFTLATFASYGRLLGDIDRAPIVRGRYGSRDQFTTGANLTYRFRFGS